MKRVLVVGATSAIAEATARCFAESGSALYLVGRREERLVAVADDLRVRGAVGVRHYVMDMNDLDHHAAMLAEAARVLGAIDVAFIAHGTLPDQFACQTDVGCALQELHTNGLSTIALLTLLAERFERQRHGTIAVITSVAGDRGRQSNYVYGAAKAAVDTFLEGLRQRLHKAGVHVVTIKPGFVDTPMTASIEKKGLLWAQPDAVGRRIHHAIMRGRDVVYVPGFWRLIMAVIRSIPRPVYKTVKL